MIRMKFLMFTLAAAASASAASLSVGSGQTVAGGTTTTSVTLDTTGASIAGLQFDLQYNTSALTISFAPGAAVNAAQKSINTSSISGGTRVLVIGFNQNLIGNGSIADLTITVGASVASGNYPLTLANVSGTDAAGNTVQVGGSGSSGTITVGTPATPHLAITKTHTGSFTQGQQGATYTVTVSNTAGAATTSGTVTVTETIPSGLSLVSMSGSNWTCSGSTCTRSDALAAGSSYPPLTVTVNVASGAPSSVTNQVTVSGGGSATANASDPTTINTVAGTPSLAIGSVSIAAGGTGTTSATLNPNGAQVAGVQFDLLYDKNALTISVSTGAAAAAAQKSVSTSSITGGTRVLVTGLNTNTIGGGSVADLSITVGGTVAAGNFPITVQNVSGTNPSGQVLAMTASSGSVTVTASSCQFSVNNTTVNLSNPVPNPPALPVSQNASVQVTPGSACTTANTWTATSSSYALLIQSGASGNGGSVGTISIQGLSNTLSSSRSLTLTITPSGPNAGAPTVVTVTQPGSGAPLLNRQVTALYQTILGRDPDPLGYAFWTGQGTAGLGQMVDSFTTSPEGFGSNFTVVAAYQAALARTASISEFTSSVAALRNGLLNVTLLLSSLNPGLSTTQVYQNLLGRAPTAAEATATPSAAFTNIINSAEFQNTGAFRTATDRSNSLYVEMLYYIILTRVLDSAGFNFWVGVANSGGSGIYFNGPTTFPVRIQILGPGAAGQGFVGSPEFQSHFQ